MSASRADWSGVGLDDEGYIRQLQPEGPLQRPFRPVVRAARRQLIDHLGDRLHSLYLYGSIARREAVPGRSDLDLTILTREVVALGDLNPVAAHLNAEHAVVTKVDLDVGTYADAVDPGNRFNWGFWLRHCCVNIYGPDVGTQFERFTPDMRIAIAINDDVGTAADVYAHGLANTKTDAERARLQQEAAKKILRSMASLIMAKANCWVTDVERAAQLARQYFGEQTCTIELLLRMTRGETLDAEQARRTIADAGRWAADRFAEVDVS